MTKVSRLDPIQGDPDSTRKHFHARMRAFAILALLVAGCGKSSPPTPPALSKPVRLLPSATSTAFETSDRYEFANVETLDGWFANDAGSRSKVSPVRRQARLHRKSGITLSEPGDLVARLIALPPFQTLSLSASYGLGRILVEEPPELRETIHLIELRTMRAGEDLDRILEVGTIEDTQGKARPIGDVLRARLELERTRDNQLRTTNKHEEGVTDTVADESGPKPTLWAAVIAPQDRAIHLHEATIDVRTRSREHQSQILSIGPIDENEGTLLVRAKVSRELRPAVWIPPERSFTTTATTPDRALALTFGTTLDHAFQPEDDAPQPASNSELKWHVEVRVAEQLVASLTGETSQSDERPRFHDHSLEWPQGAPAGAEVVVTWHNDGPLPLVLAQPMIAVREANPHPNLLLISIDTLRADHVGFLGYDRPTTPYLDELAERATLFRNYRAVSSYTIPTHATMLTGLLPLTHGAYRPVHRLATESLPYLPRILAEAGYHAAGFTGGGYISEDFGFAVGFDQFSNGDPIPPHDGVLKRRIPANFATLSMQDVGEWIERRRDERWFAFLHTFAVHDYDPPRDVFARFDTEPESRFRETLDRVPTPNFWEQRTASEPLTDGDVQHFTDLYDAAIANVDAELRALMEPLWSSGDLDNTIVVITSDHGEELFDHGNIGHGISLYEEALRIPLLVILPNGTPRTVRDQISQLDLMPTLLDLLGYEIPEGLDGRSRAAQVLGTPSNDPLAPYYGHLDTKRYTYSAIMDQSWKLIRGRAVMGKLDNERSRELFDLATDADEAADLAEKSVERVMEMDQRIRTLETLLREKQRGGGMANLSDDVREQLKQLGYAR